MTGIAIAMMIVALLVIWGGFDRGVGIAGFCQGNIIRNIKISHDKTPI